LTLVGAYRTNRRALFPEHPRGDIDIAPPWSAGQRITHKVVTRVVRRIGQ